MRGRGDDDGPLEGRTRSGSAWRAGGGWLGATALGLVGATLSGCADRAGDRDLATAIEAQLAPHVQRGDLSGAVVAGREDRVLYARGFHLADAETRAGFTPETPVPLGAAAETVTAAAVWLLAEEGRGERDAPVQRYLARFPWPEPTLRHLLGHSAGLPSGDASAWPEASPAGEASAVERLARLGDEPVRPPGSLYEHSPVGYELLGEVVEVVEGKPLESFVRERLLDRVGIPRPGDGVPAMALSYRREEGWLKPDPVSPPPAFTGARGLALSALDLYRWCVSFYLDPVLRDETLERGGRPMPLEGGASAVDQLGWTWAAGGRRYRMASLGGHDVFAYRDESRRLGVVMVSNTAMPLAVRPRLARALVRTLEGVAPERIEVPPAAPLPAGDLSPVLGEFDLPVLGRLTLRGGEEGLVARLGEGPRYRARRAGEAHLHVPGLDAWLTLGPPGDASFRAIHWESVFQAARGERIAAAPETTAKEVQP